MTRAALFALAFVLAVCLWQWRGASIGTHPETLSEAIIVITQPLDVSRTLEAKVEAKDGAVQESAAKPMGRGWTQIWRKDMPRLSREHSPDHASWNNSIALCAAMKNEAIGDVQEWLRYYRHLGVDHVAISDNMSVNYKKMYATLTAEFPSSFLTLRTEPTERGQMPAYLWCIENLRESYNWIAFFDLDEYLVIRKPQNVEAKAPSAIPGRGVLKPFLDEFKFNAGVSFNWMMVGPSGVEQRELSGVLREFRQCDPRPDYRLKTIANTYFIDGMPNHPHNVIYRLNMTSVLPNGFPAPRRLFPLHEAVGITKDGVTCTRNWSELTEACHAREGTPKWQATCCWERPAATVPRALADVERAALFHFATKSRADFERKMARGSGSNAVSRGWTFYQDLEKVQQKAAICQEPSKLWDACCSPEALKAWDADEP